MCCSCPKDVIALTAKAVNVHGYQYAEAVRPDDCIGCASCGIVCPDGCISVYRKKWRINTMAEQEVKLMKGNEALAHAAIRCGCDGYFGYPITPQTEVIETLSELKPWETTGMVVLQAESEVASINMLYGGGGSGKRVMTSSSSPGVSLMQEGISYMAGAEVPGLIVDVQRGSLVLAPSSLHRATISRLPVAVAMATTIFSCSRRTLFRRWPTLSTSHSSSLSSIASLQ